MQHVQLFHPTDGWQVGIGERKRKSEKHHKIDIKQNKNSSPWRGKAQVPQPKPKMITKMVGLF
jgi:hypothetical protein